MTRDKAGNLYGTTMDGGPDNVGVVYKLATDGTESVLHSFGNNHEDDGTTQLGGASNAGTIFKVRK